MEQINLNDRSNNYCNLESGTIEVKNKQLEMNQQQLVEQQQQTAINNNNKESNLAANTLKVIKQAKQLNKKSLIKFEIDRSYVFSLKALIRLLIILFQFGGWVSLLSIVKAEYLRMFSFNGSAIAYLVFSLSGFFISIIIFVLNSLDLIKSESKIIISLIDAAFIVPMIILGVFCAINETYYNDPKYESFAKVVLNRGAAASAGFFGCSLGVLYFASTIICFRL